MKKKKSVINTLSFLEKKSQAAIKYFGNLLNYGFHTCLPKLELYVSTSALGETYTGHLIYYLNFVKAFMTH